MEDEFDDAVEIIYEGEWPVRKREDFPLPENLPREVRRLVWWLQDIGCVRSPFIGSTDCFDFEDYFELSMMCPRCRALNPYKEFIR